MVEAEGHVFKALASEHRRRILDLLAPGPQTTGWLASRMPALSRFAVMQHLGVLEEAGLVVVRREGRLRFNHLNAVPLRRAYQRWVGPLADAAAGRALALETYLEGEEHMRNDQAQRSVRAVRIETEIVLRARPEKVWAALTDEQAEWYPHHYGGARLQRVVFEHQVGGRFYEDWGEGAGVLYGTVAYYDAGRAYCTRGHLRGGTTLEQWIVLEPRAQGETVLKQSMVAFGELSEDEVAAIHSHGDLGRYEAALREWVEREHTAPAV